MDRAARTVEAIVSTGADVQRAGFIERLPLDAVDLSRLPGGPVLDAHRTSSPRDQLGVIEAAALRPEGPWTRMRMRSTAADCLRRAGNGTAGLSADTIITRAIAHTTPDFRLILSPMFA